ncbi:MAG: hypothetical protein ACOYJK_09640, partial [Prevotella sp.]
MKKLLSLFIILFFSMTVSAQVDGDQITINLNNGKKTTYNLTGSSNALSSLKHSANGEMEVYLKGLEEIGAWETYDVNSISSIIFNVQR